MLHVANIVDVSGFFKKNIEHQSTYMYVCIYIYIYIPFHFSMLPSRHPNSRVLYSLMFPWCPVVSSSSPLALVENAFKVSAG